MACLAKRRGRYVLDFYDNQGKRQRQTLKKGTTKKRAKEILRDIEDQIDKGIYFPKSKIPLFSEVAKDCNRGRLIKKLSEKISCLISSAEHCSNCAN